MPSNKSRRSDEAAITAFGNFMHQTLIDHTDILECAYSKETTEDERIRDRSESSSSGDEENSKKESSVAESVAEFHKNDVNGNVVERSPNEFEHVSNYLKLTVYLAWFVLIFMAYIRAFLKRMGFEKNKAATEMDKQKVDF
uniref:Uncharacterized protein n=1 Tax=Panagrolaimus davidi TaxID=227884 RepID=A0A914Q695_9BILA